VPVLTNPKHEKFCLNLNKGMKPTQAYVKAGYSKTGADQSASRLLRNPLICSRVAELREIISSQVVKLEIADRNHRVRALQDRWDKLQQVIAERASDPATAAGPGGKTGLLCRTLKSVGSGKDAQLIDEWTVDTGLLREIRAHEQQAAQELGQWSADAGAQSQGAQVLQLIVIQAGQQVPLESAGALDISALVRQV